MTTTANLMKLSDARIRLLCQRMELIATEISQMYSATEEDIDLADRAIEVLYMRTRALRQKEGVDRINYEQIRVFLHSLNIEDFVEGL